jgi:hypothetical protein
MLAFVALIHALPIRGDVHPIHNKGRDAICNTRGRVFSTRGRKRGILSSGGELEFACIRSWGPYIHALGALRVAEFALCFALLPMVSRPFASP